MAYKYNPAFYSEQELVDGFVVRHRYLDLIIETLKENSSAASNQHLLIVGPRGSGKTTLVRRVAAEINRNPQLSLTWYPVVFAEESYAVSTPGEFWLEALRRLQVQTANPQLQTEIESLASELDETVLRERALGKLLNFGSTRSQRLALIVENLNTLVGSMMESHADWELRHTLQSEPALMLIGTSTARFDEIENVDKAWFELFSIVDLKPLNFQECAELWSSLSQHKMSSDQIRAIQILTGGNPRLLKILAEFSLHASFRQLMINLIKLIDDNTEHFKSQLDYLAPVERKVFVTLLNVWDPADAKTVAKLTRMDVSKVSALLNRLVKRGAVVISKEKPRRHVYYASERLFNIYYLMRQFGHPAQRVKAAVRFMIQFYDRSQIVQTLSRLAEETCSLEPGTRMDHFWAYDEIIRQIPEEKLRAESLRATPSEFFRAADMPVEVRTWADEDVKQWIRRGQELETEGNISEAEMAYRKAIEVNPRRAVGWYRLGRVLTGTTRLAEAEQALRKAIELGPNLGWALHYLGVLLAKQNRFSEAELVLQEASQKDPANVWHLIELGDLSAKTGRIDEAEKLFRKATMANPGHGFTWYRLGTFLAGRTERTDEAESALRKAIALDASWSMPFTELAKLLRGSGRHAEAEALYKQSISAGPKGPYSYLEFADFLAKEKGELDEADKLYREAVRLSPDNSWPWSAYADFLARDQNKLQQAEKAYRKVTEIAPKEADGWIQLGTFYQSQPGRTKEAEQSFLEAASLAPHSGHPWIHLGQLYATLPGRASDAENAFKRTIGLEPKNPYSWVAFARYLREYTARFSEAEAAMREALRLEPDSWSALGELGILLGRERPEEAEKAFRKALAYNNSSHWLWGNWADHLSSESRNEEAEEAFRKALELLPSSATAWAHLGELLGEIDGRESEAEQACRKAIELDNSAHTWTHLGSVLSRSAGKITEAEQAFRRAIELDPDYAFAFEKLGTLLLKIDGRKAEARELLTKASTIEGPSGIAWLALLESYVADATQVSEVVELVQNSLKRKGRTASSLNGVAHMLYRQAKANLLRFGLELARESVAIEPNNLATIQTLVSILVAENEWVEALSYSGPLLRATCTNENALRRATDLIISVAAAGYGSDCLNAIERAKATNAMEPLTIGLKLYLGESVQRAPELMEVARDIVSRIRALEQPSKRAVEAAKVEDHSRNAEEQPKTQ